MPNLPFLIKRIRNQIPVNHLIIVDGHSTDGTLQYAKRESDITLTQPNTGVGEARQIALENIETQIYASFDSDIHLPPEWYKTVSPNMKENVAVTSTPVIFGKPGFKPLQKMYEFSYFQRMNEYPTLANSLQNTEIIRRLGGFNPKLLSGEDTDLMKRVKKSKYQWVIERRISVPHPRTITEDLEHVKWWGNYFLVTGLPVKQVIIKFLKSFREGLILAYRAHPALLWYKPMRDLAILKAYLEGCKNVSNRFKEYHVTEIE